MIDLGRVGRHVYELHVLGTEYDVTAALSDAGFSGLKFTSRSRHQGSITVIEIDSGFADLGEVRELLLTKGFACSEVIQGHK